MLACATAQAEKPMNFVVIIADDMPPEYIGAYGVGKYPTPNIDKLARDGERFTTSFSISPMCTPARFAIMTGRYPCRCTAPLFKKDAGTDPSQPAMIAWNTPIDSQELTLAKQLTAQGYNTGIAGKWHLATHADEAPLPDLKDGSLECPDTLKQMELRQQMIQKFICESGGFTCARSLFIENCDEEPLVANHNIPYITRGAIEILHTFAKEEKPFLLITTPTGIHGPWLADVLDKDLHYTPGGYIEDIYDYAPNYAALRKTIETFSSGEKHKHVGMVEIDYQLGRIRAELEKLGLADNTAVIFTSDHGVEPGKCSVYDRGMRVPFIVYWPRLTAPGTVTDSMVQHVDLTASIAATAGVPDIGKTMDGVDLRPVLTDPSATVRKFAYFECGYSRGITDGRYKLISTRLPDSIITKALNGEYKWMTVGMGPGSGAHAAFSQLAYPDYYAPDQFYDFKRDPYEQDSVFANPEYASAQAKLRTALTQITDSMPYAFPEEVQPFFATTTYKKLSERTRRENDPTTKDWVKRDHDQIIWPPNN